MFGGRHFGRFSREQEKATDVGKTLRRLLGYFQPFWGLLAVAALFVVISSLLQLAGPYLIGVAVDQFIAPGDEPRPAWLSLLIAQDASRGTGLTATMLLLLSSYLLSWVATAGQFYLMMLAGQRVLLHTVSYTHLRAHET